MSHPSAYSRPHGFDIRPCKVVSRGESSVTNGWKLTWPTEGSTNPRTSVHHTKKDAEDAYSRAVRDFLNGVPPPEPKPEPKRSGRKHTLSHLAIAMLAHTMNPAP